MRVTGIVWMGVRSAAQPEMHRLFADVMGLTVVRETAGVSWLALPGGEEIQLYDDTDQDHTFFPEGPVIGFPWRTTTPHTPSSARRVSNG